MKEKRIEKEIKKAQKKGIYNPKLKLGIVGLILVIGTVIGVSYAYYTDKSNTVLTISGTVSKKIMVTINAINGTVNSSIQTVDYGTPATFTVTPNTNYEYNSVQCLDTSNQDVTQADNATYTSSNNTLTVTPKTSQDVTCTVTFIEKIVKIFDHEYKVIQGDPDFSNGEPPVNGIQTMGSGLYSAKDNDGTSYYFRGAVENNYVQFGKDSSGKDLTWRIVRINGDRSIRLILNDDIGEGIYQSDTLYFWYHNSDVQLALKQWYETNLEKYNDKINTGKFCEDSTQDSASIDDDWWDSFDTYNRIKNAQPKLECPDSDIIFDKIGIISADEALMAGLGNNISHASTSDNYLYHEYYWLSLGLIDVYFDFDKNSWEGYIVTPTDGYMFSNFIINEPAQVVPVINLNSNITATGNGTIDDPFVIK